MARGGRYWNLGLADTSQLGATDSQYRKLKSLYKKDYRGSGLTREKASELIEKGLEEKALEKTGLSSMADQLFTHLMKRAIEAANEAGDAWLAEHPEPLFVVSTPEGLLGVHDTVGHAVITAPKKGSGLAKWLIEHEFDDRRNSRIMPLDHKHVDRLEGGLHLAACIAALDVLREAETEIGDIRIIFHCDQEDFKLAA
jgi:hypothetical protein